MDLTLKMSRKRIPMKLVIARIAVKHELSYDQVLETLKESKRRTELTDELNSFKNGLMESFKEWKLNRS